MLIAKNKFNMGEIVFDKVRPNQKLTVTRIIDNLYYCQTQEKNSNRLLVFFENDLRGIVIP